MKKFTTLVLASTLCSSILLPSAQAAQAASEQVETKENKKAKKTKTEKKEVSYPYADRLPAWDDNYWRYINDQDDWQARRWIMGTAHDHYDQFDIEYGGIEGGKDAFRKYYDELQQDPYTKDRRVRIFIMYMPNCPYTKSYLPQFKKLAMEAQAPVLNCDVSKYMTATLAPYFDAMNSGVVSPTILWETKEGKLKGESGVHSAKRFAEILEECGYPKVATSEDTSGYTAEDRYKDDLLAQTNRERIAKGLKPLSMFKAVNDVADLRSQEIVKRIEHTRPNGTSYTTALTEAGINGPNLYGENIAAGPAVTDPWSVNRAWMNSQPHRENILRKEFSHIGIGHYNNTPDATHKYKDHWTQLFLGECTMDKISLSTKSVNVLKGTPISDLGIKVNLHCSTHGDSEMPLIDEMVTGYNPDKEGEQSVTVHYGDQTQQLLITVGQNEPAELKADMIRFNGKERSKKPQEPEKTPSYEYTGQPIRPEVTVNNPSGEYTLMEGYSYDVRYENNVERGKGKVIITGKGNYKGRVEKEFDIKERNLNDKLDISGIKDTYEYTGKPITPTPQVKTKDGLELYEGVDYEVEYQDNTGELVKETGKPVHPTDKKAKVIITGKGNYNFKKELEFGFHMNEDQKASETLAFVMGAPDMYKNLYDYFKYLVDNKKTGPAKIQMQDRYQKLVEYSASMGAGKEIKSKGTWADRDAKIKDLQELAARPETKEGYDKLVGNALVPEAADVVNQWIDIVQESRGIKKTSTKVEDKNDKVTGTTVEGLTSILTDKDQSAELKVDKPADNSVPTLNPETYDAVGAIPVSLSVEFKKTGGSSTEDVRTELPKPVTITMDMPKDFDPKNEIVAVFKDSKSRRSRDGEDKVTEIPLSVSKDGSKMTLTTTKMGDCVITQKLPVTNNENKVVPPANNPQLSGVSFGEQSNEGPEAPKDLKVYRDKDGTVKVDWKDPSLNGYTLKDFTVAFSQNQDMTNAQYVTVDKEKKTLEIPKLPAGTYYFTVTTNASSDWSSDASRTSLPVMLEIPGDQEKKEEFKPVYNINSQAGSNGKLDVEVEKKEVAKKSAEKDDKKTAQAGDTVKVITTANEKYLNGWVKVTDVNGNEVSLKKSEAKNGAETYTFTMPANNVTITSSYTLKEVPLPKFDLSFGQVEHGQIIYSDSEVSTMNGKHEIASDTEVGFQVKPEEGYKVKEVAVVQSKDGKKVALTSENDGKYKFTMPKSDVTIQATFEKIEAEKPETPEKPDAQYYTITKEDTMNGTFSIPSLAKENDLVTIKTKPNQNFFTEQVVVTTADGKKVEVAKADNNEYQFVMPKGSVFVKVNFAQDTIEEEDKEESITLNPTQHGQVELPKQAFAGEDVVLKATPDQGYKVDFVQVVRANGQKDLIKVKELSNDHYVFTMPDSAVKVTVQFAKVEDSGTDKPGQPEQPEKPEKPEVPEKPELPENPEKPEKPVQVTEEKEIKEAVSISSDYATIFADTKLQSGIAYAKGSIFDAVKQAKLNGELYYQVARAGKVMGWVAAKDMKVLVATAVNKPGTITENTVATAHLYRGGKKTSLHKDQLVEMKATYTTPDGKQYVEVVEPQKDGNEKVLGYVEASKVAAVKSIEDKANKVALKAKVVWKDLYQTKTGATLKENQLYQVKRYYTINGQRLYSVYSPQKDGSSKWVGYVDATTLQDLKSVQMKEQMVTVKAKSSYTLWKDFFYQEKKGHTKQGQNFITSRYYDVNGKRYYSVYRVDKNNKKKWMGYVNANAVRALKPTKVNRTKTITKGNYRVWNNLYWTQQLGTTKNMVRKSYKVTYEYQTGNGAKYYALQDTKGRFVGYVNQNATK